MKPQRPDDGGVGQTWGVTYSGAAMMDMAAPGFLHARYFCLLILHHLRPMPSVRYLYCHVSEPPHTSAGRGPEKRRRTMAVSRCICHAVTFVKGLELARRHGCTTVAELQGYVPLGTGCGLCIPYMQRALATGETDLPVLGERESDQWLERSGVITEGKG